MVYQNSLKSHSRWSFGHRLDGDKKIYKARRIFELPGAVLEEEGAGEKGYTRRDEKGWPSKRGVCDSRKRAGE